MVRARVSENKGLIHRAKEFGCHLERCGGARETPCMCTRVCSVRRHWGIAWLPVPPPPASLPILVCFVPSFSEES